MKLILKTVPRADIENKCSDDDNENAAWSEDSVEDDETENMLKRKMKIVVNMSKWRNWWRQEQCLIMSIMETMTDVWTIVVLDNSHEYEESDEEEGNEVGEEDNEISEANE